MSARLARVPRERLARRLKGFNTLQACLHQIGRFQNLGSCLCSMVVVPELGNIQWKHLVVPN